MGYRIKTFGNAKSYTEDDYLENAIELYEWVESNRIDSDKGISYRVNPGSVIEFSEHQVHGRHRLYSGSAGVGIFLIRLYEILNDKKYLDEAKGILEELIVSTEGSEFYVEKIKSAPESDLKVTGWHTGVYTGPGGAGILALEIYRFDKNDKYIEFAEKISDDIISASKIIDGKGITLTGDTDIFSDGGFVLYFLSLYKVTGNEKYLNFARDFAAYIYSTAVSSEKEGLFFYANNLEMVGMPKDSIYPGFAHGTSGIGYLLAVLYTYDKKEWELNGAIEVSKFLDSISDCYENGRLIPYNYGGKNEEEYEGKYYLGFCHGPAGTSLLYRKLYDITGEKKYLQALKELAQGIIIAGAPEYNSWGFWNSYCTCCGTPGLIEYFADLYEYTKDDKYLEYAKRAAAKTIGDATSTGKGKAMYGSWDRTDPKNIQSFTGLYTGAAGAGANLLRLYATVKGKNITPLWEYSYL